MAWIDVTVARSPASGRQSRFKGHQGPANFCSALAAGLMAGSINLGAFALPALLVSIPDVRGFRRELRERFDDAPHCAACQYNLTGNFSGICPECGTPIASLAPAG
ncbi:MAG: hypothetical protein IT449_13520 [Phycisphaerales bacterium]|nr:hypothetical protein [Phycisphaerales bacterium]